MHSSKTDILTIVSIRFCILRIFPVIFPLLLERRQIMYQLGVIGKCKAFREEKCLPTKRKRKKKTNKTAYGHSSFRS